MRLLGSILIATLFAAPGLARANDSAADLAAGGLVMVRTDAISIQREDLSLSFEEGVHVRYEFRNDRTVPVTFRVAFPLPALPVETPASTMAIKYEAAPNFLGFSVTANGARVEPEVEIKAEMPDGRDVAAVLREIGGWPLILHPSIYINDQAASKRNDLTRIDASVFRKLHELGLIDGDDEAGGPRWTTRITYHWLQTFQPGVTVIEHAYAPIGGGGPIGRNPAGSWEGGGVPDDLATTYCIDDASSRTMQALAARARDVGYLRGATLSYILKTATNWAGSIGTFHLTIREPGMVFLCSDIPFHRDARSWLDGTVSDYTPTANLRVLMVWGN